MKHRKLFPAPTELTNSTTECIDGFCDPSCPDKCYPYSDYFFLPPPPSPSPPPRLFRHLSLNYVIIVVALLASFLLFLVCYYMIIARSCSGWFSSRNRRRPAPPDDSSADEEEFVGDHHVWFITTTGLQQSVINSIAVCKYKRGEGLIEGTECSVCLAEFQQDETLRLLPKCSHAFHISCIDTWLRSHTNCPLCRACIVGELISGSTVVPVDQNPDTQREDSHVECDSGNAWETDEGHEHGITLEGLAEVTQPNDSAEAANKFLVKLDHSRSASEGSSVEMSMSTENTITTTSSTDGDDSSSTGTSSTVQCLQKIPAAMQ